MSKSIPSSQISKPFMEFAKFGDTKSDGKQITLKNADIWMKQANLFDKNLTPADTAIGFAKFKNNALNQTMFMQYVNGLCKTKHLDVNQFITKLVSCGVPNTSKATVGCTACQMQSRPVSRARKESAEKTSRGDTPGRNTPSSRDGAITKAGSGANQRKVVSKARKPAADPIQTEVVSRIVTGLLGTYPARK